MDVGTLGTSIRSQRTDPASFQDSTSAEVSADNGEEARKTKNIIRGGRNAVGEGTRALIAGDLL
jgi:hypothetical protein